MVPVGTEMVLLPFLMCHPMHTIILGLTTTSFSPTGIERSASEMSMGNIDLSGAFSPYSTRQVSLPEDDFNKLLNLTNYNVLNNAGTIVHVLHKAIELKRHAQASQISC